MKQTRLSSSNGLVQQRICLSQRPTHRPSHEPIQRLNRGRTDTPCLTESASTVKPARMVMIRRHVLRLVLTLFTAGAVLGFASPALAEKFAVVDVQRAVTETEDGMRAKATLKKLFEQRQTELSKAEQGLGQQKQSLEKDRAKLTTEEYGQRLETLQREAMKLQQQMMVYQQELQKKQGELLERIHRGIMAIIRRIATQDGFDLVIDRNAVPYARTDLDITDRVITQYNKQNSGKKK